MSNQLLRFIQKRSRKENFALSKVFLLASFFFWFIPFITAFFVADIFQHQNSGRIPVFRFRLDTFSLIRNNLGVVFVNISGLLTFGITTILNLMVNGFTLGLFLKTSLHYASLSLVAEAFLPHFTEYIAIVLSGAIGLEGFQLLKKLKIGYFNRKKLEYILLLVLLSVILIVIAGFVEAHNPLVKRSLS